MKKTLLFTVLAMSASLVAAQFPAKQMMTMPAFEKNVSATNLKKVQSSVSEVKAVSSVVAKSNLAANKSMTLKFAGEENGYLNYYLPTNAFTIGFPVDLSSLTETDPFYSGIGLYPAYQEVTWKGLNGASAYSWEYMDPDSERDSQGLLSGSLFAETQAFKAPAYEAFEAIYAPALTTTVNGQASTYQYESLLLCGANLDSQNQLWGAATWDVDGLFKTLEDNDSRAGFYPQYCYGFGAVYKATYQKGLELPADTEINLGFGVVIPAPEVPYMLSYVYAPAITEPQNGFSLSPDSKFNIAVYEVDAKGYIAKEPMATGTCTPDEMIDGNALFFLGRQDGDLFEYVDLTIDMPIYVEMTLDSADATDNVCLPTLLAADTDGLFADNCFVRVNNQYLLPLDKTFTFDKGTLSPKSFRFQFGITNNWLFTTDGVTSAKDIATTGGSATFHLNTLFGGEEMFDVEGEGLYDWFDYEVGEFDDQTGNEDITFTLQALPEGVEGRTARVTVSVPGCYGVDFIITQGKDAGVEGVKVNANTAKVVDGNIVLNAAKATSAKVYNAAGQVVASAEVKGETVVPAADLAHGMYIVKFNDNTAVKVMK